MMQKPLIMQSVLHPLFLLLVFSPTLLKAQSLFDRLYDGTGHQPVAVVLSFPVDSLLEKSNNEQESTFTFADEQGEDRTWDAKLSVRGKFRRKRCEYPPIKLDFDKDELREAGLAEHDKFKLVTTCFEDREASNLVLKEYLAYRAYAMLIPEAHYRAQLLEVTYRDTEGNHKDRTELAFILEDTDEMAARAGGKELESAIGLSATLYDEKAEAAHALFQYLVGNCDWSLPLHRNVKVVELSDGKLIPVGYDFDFSGWVGAPYASPSRENGQQSIYERVYQGYSQSDRVLRDANADFRSHRREVVDLIKDFEYLPKDERTVLRRFVLRFYDSLTEMTANTTTLLYDQLRGSAAKFIPPGGEPKYYRSMGR